MGRDALACCLDAALAGWDGPARAWSYAPVHTAGLEGLPIGHHPHTDQVLRAAGFDGKDLWSYQQLPGTRTTAPLGELWRTHQGVTRDEQGEPVAQWEAALVADDPVPTGALWWLETRDDVRGQGHGRRALEDAITHLRASGARDVIGYVDDERGCRPERAAAKSLYRSAGFVEIAPVVLPPRRHPTRPGGLNTQSRPLVGRLCR